MSASIVQLAVGADEATIQAAIAALPDGGTLVLPANQVIAIVDGLQLSVAHRSITFDLNGSTLQQAGDSSVISINGGHVSGQPAVLGTTAAGAVTVTYAGAAKVVVGDYVKVYADDGLPNDHGTETRLGQAMKVVAVSGDTLTLAGELANADLYQTNIRASTYLSGTAVVRNGTVRGDQSHPDWENALISVRSTIGTHVDGLTVRDGNSMGMNFVDTVNALVTQSATINLIDDVANGHYGYGVHSASSLNTTVQGLYAERVRHATDDNAVGISAAHPDPSKYGADIGLTVSDAIAVATSSYAFSWHSEGRMSKISDSLVFNSYGVLGARGTDNSFINVSGAGNNRGILFYEYGDGDGQRITVSGVHLKENSGYAYFNQNDAKNNTIADSSFEIASNKVTINPSDGTTTFIDDTLKVGAFVTNETIAGTSAADTLLGGKGGDTIAAGPGDDYIWGGEGADMLTGDTGIDRFAYLAMSEAGDTITDFQPGAGGDVIDLAALSRTLGWSGDLIAQGYLRFVQSGGDTLFQVDADGGGDDFLTMATLAGVRATAVTTDNYSTRIVVVEQAGISGPVAGSASAIALTQAQSPEQPVLSLRSDALVDGSWYDRVNLDVANAQFPPALHYDAYGWREGRDPDALFSTVGYLAANPDVRLAGVNPLQHYDDYGWKEGRDPSAQFDTQLYLMHNPDVAVAGMDPLFHYLTYGKAEGRQTYAAIGPWVMADGFDPEYYLLANPDVARAGIDPYTHYEEYGWREGRQPNAYFDPKYYLAQNPDVALAGMDPLTHYDLFGWHEGRNPSASFDTNAYLTANPDVAAAHIDPLVHYLAWGALEGRTITSVDNTSHDTYAWSLLWIW